MLDFQAIFLAVWLPLLLWIIAVGGATFSGYPGVICVTPLGWLLGLSVGLRTVQYTSSRGPVRCLVEAGSGGAILGFLQGMIFAAVVAFFSPLGIESGKPIDALISALISVIAVGGIGALVCASLAAIMAAIADRRSGF
jgi:hypothetical protein